MCGKIMKAGGWDLPTFLPSWNFAPMILPELVDDIATASQAGKPDLRTTSRRSRTPAPRRSRNAPARPAPLNLGVGHFAGSHQESKRCPAALKTLGKNHPGVLMLFPLAKPAAAPELQSRPKKHVTLNTRLELSRREEVRRDGVERHDCGTCGVGAKSE